MITHAYLWDMETYWECRFCHRRWRKKEPMSEENDRYLSEHTRTHTGMPDPELPSDYQQPRYRTSQG